MAKIATDPSPGNDSRVICVYTKDFSDEADVRRVLDELIDIGVVQRDQPRSTPYKPDAYTYLDINSNNPYKIPASLYLSRDMLNPPKANGKRQATTSPMASKDVPKSKKQSTLGNFFKR